MDDLIQVDVIADGFSTKFTFVRFITVVWPINDVRYDPGIWFGKGQAWRGSGRSPQNYFDVLSIIPGFLTSIIGDEKALSDLCNTPCFNSLEI